MLNDYAYASTLEWLETNGLGGYASGTVSGAHSRRYHGLLVAAMRPPVGRVLVLSKLEETIIINGQHYALSCNQYPGALHPQGFQYLKKFQRDLFPEFIYEAGDVTIKKTIAAVQGENTTLVLYEVLSSPAKFSLEFLPLCSCRDFHSTTRANESINKNYTFDKGVFATKNYADSPELSIVIPGSSFEPSQYWYNNFEFSVEKSRGLNFQEDLFNHGKFSVELKSGSKLGVILTTENSSGKDAFKLFDKEKRRREKLVENYAGSIRRLMLAADQFIVKRGDRLKTIIAGYHWFSDWGRDTMIALPGLCLVTKRFDDAKKILQAFADSVSEGMLPNRFPDSGESPEYNTVDATLWFFQAIYKYYQYTSDLKFIKTLLPVLKDIIAWHDKGTRYSIHLDQQDYLIYAGQDGVQLTWMDAKVGNWVVTPRIGKPVEINALWYNALMIMSELLSVTNDKTSVDYKKRSVTVMTSFQKNFWNEAKGYLYDFVKGEDKNDDLRPNQVYAISLPFPLLSKEKSKAVLSSIEEKLLTPYGLRSLTPDHKDYRPVYEGDQWHRDGAYHQGTVWSFLIGPYIDALIRVRGAKGKTEAKKIITKMFHHLDEAGVGSISEIFDGEAPHTPKGCVAQAWGVAELLRVSLEYKIVGIKAREN